MTPQETDKLIDRFVAVINQQPRCLLDAESVPESVATTQNEHDEWDWQIRPYEVTWIEPLENVLKTTIPLLFRSFVTRWIFPSFEIHYSRGNQVQPLKVFGNTPEGNCCRELRNDLTSHTHIASELVRCGYLQFASPDDVNYDAICFDLNSMKDGDAPIVLIDHEALLCFDKIEVRRTIAASFEDLIRSTTDG